MRHSNPYPTVEKAKNRVRLQSEPDLLTWLDNAGAGVARAISDYRRSPAPEHLVDMHSGLQTMLGVVESLRERAH